MRDDGFKQCPFCKEQIRKEAVKCRFCGEWVDQVLQPAGNSLRTPALDEPIPAPLPSKSKGTPPVGSEVTSSSVTLKSEGAPPPTILKVIGICIMGACSFQASNIFKNAYLSHVLPFFLIEALFRVALGFGIGGWIVWEIVRWFRGRRCVSIKAGCLFLAFIFVYYVVAGFYETKQPPPETNSQGTSNLVEFVSGVKEFSKQGGYRRLS